MRWLARASRVPTRSSPSGVIATPLTRPGQSSTRGARPGPTRNSRPSSMGKAKGPADPVPAGPPRTATPRLADPIHRSAPVSASRSMRPAKRWATSTWPSAGRGRDGTSGEPLPSASARHRSVPSARSSPWAPMSPATATTTEVSSSSETATMAAPPTPPGSRGTDHRGRPSAASTTTAPPASPWADSQVTAIAVPSVAAGPRAGPGSAVRQTTWPSARSKAVSDPSHVETTAIPRAITGELARSPTGVSHRSRPLARSTASTPSSVAATTRSAVKAGATSRRPCRSSSHCGDPSRSRSTTPRWP